MIKKNCILLLAVLSSVQLLSAQQLPSTLLWKISGNGLQKASYLYGTMHLTDERIFNLGDSLYKAIEHSDGFAIEIDPQEFTPLVIDEAKKSYLDAVLLKNMMPQDKFKKYGKLLGKRLNKNENDITTADVLREKNKWIQESYSTGKMQTFLDTYLFDIARRQGKWTGGVEDMKDQEGLADLVDESDIEELAMSGNEDDTKKTNNVYLDYFINAYVKNDLNSIDSLSNLDDSLHLDALLVKRNKKMAMRMDSLSHERSNVFAVGAAHLPGDKGLIALLKEKGFTMTPVFSSVKIKPADYKVAEVPLQWHDAKDSAGLYTASMPGKPGNMVFAGTINMQIYFDVFSSTLYMSTALKTPYSQTMADSIFGGVTSYFFSIPDYTKGKPVTIGNVPGREFVSKKGNYSHGYLLFKDGEMYMALAMSMKKDSSAATDINRFLHSFTIIEHKPADNKVFAYTNKIKAYRLQLPAPPQSGSDLIAAFKDSTVTREISVSGDPVTGAYLLFGTNESAPGYYIENDSVTLAQIEKTQKDKFKKLNIDTTYLSNGLRTLDLEGMMARMPLMMKAHYRFRGNRWYALVAIYDTTKDKVSVERFFNSFAILDYSPTEWNNYTSGDTVFSTWAPNNFTRKIKSSGNTAEYSASYGSYDSTRGDTYTIVSQGFSKYYWQKSDSALWGGIIKLYETGDSILLKKVISNGASNGYELEIQEKGSDNVKRIGLLLNAGKLYTLITVQAASEMNNADNDKFFHSFRFNNIQPNTNLLISKAPLLLSDIASNDSAVATDAAKYLSAAPFTKNELPIVHKALLKHYPFDGDQYGYGIKNELRKIIVGLKDTSSFTFAKNNYNAADDTTRNILLTIMASFPTQQNFNDIKNILLHQTPRLKPDYALTSTLTDSIQLAAGILPNLLPLLKDTVMAPAIIAISKRLLDSGMIDIELLQQHEADIINLSRIDYAALAADPDNYRHIDYDLEKVLGEINTAKTNAMLQKWSVSRQPYLQLYAVNFLLQNKQVINPLAVQALAKDKSTRIELYDTLKACKKQNLFPVRYLTQKYFAESLVSSAGDDDYPSAIIFLADKVLNFKGRQSRFYFYKVAFGDSDDVRYSLGCAGPFPVNITDVSSKDAFGEIDEDEDFDPSGQTTQRDAIIKQMEDRFEWKEKK